jgi:hypothetical protein
VNHHNYLLFLTLESLQGRKMMKLDWIWPQYLCRKISEGENGADQESERNDFESPLHFAWTVRRLRQRSNRVSATGIAL